MRTTCLKFFLFLAFFTLVFGQSVIELQQGIPFVDYVATNHYRYYKLNLLPAGDKNLIITCTPTTGDPDLYVSLDFAYPNASTPGVIMGRAYGQDSVTVPHSLFSSHTIVYISIFGYRTSNYSIVATVEGTIRLLPGIPISGNVSFEHMDYFNFTVPVAEQNQQISIIITPLSGLVALFVSATTQPVISNNNTYSWRTHRFPAEALYISPSDPNWPLNGQFFIGVFGISIFNRYVLTVATNDTDLILRDGIFLSDTVEFNRFKYYVAIVAEENCSLSIIATSLFGDPDIFVSRTNHYPNQTNYEKSSTLWGTDTITFNPAPVGEYFIGVYGFRNSSYTIVATTFCSGDTNRTHGYIHLVDGVPQIGQLADNSFQYYEIEILDHDDISISVTRTYGDPDLYVHTNKYSPGAPTPTNYQWSSALHQSFMDTVLIHRSDPGFCQFCTLLIGVYADTSCGYYIVATTHGAITTLSDGVPVQEVLRRDEYEYFQFRVQSLDHNHYLSISITDFGQGDPDLYVSTRPRPNATNYIWKAERFGSDSVIIDAFDSFACRYCTYYISVHAFLNTSFTILARSVSPRRLVDGVPQRSYLPSAQTDMYVVDIAPGNPDISISVSTFYGMVFLIATNQEDYPDFNKPGSFNWSDISWNSIKSVVIRSPTPGHYWIAVYSVTNASYSITYSSASALIPLQNGVPQRRQLNTGKWQYFFITVTNPNQDLSIIVTPITGDPDLYVSNRTQRPNSTFYDRFSNYAYGVDSVDYEHPTAVGTYYIGVTAYRNATYSITALVFDDSTNYSIPIFDGQPQQGVLTRGHWRYYSYYSYRDGIDITISVTRVYGDPDLYISDDNIYPSFSHYDYSANTASSDVVRIRSAPSLPFPYRIGVYGFTACAYSISVSTSQTVVQLQQGIPRTGSLDRGSIDYYMLWVDANDVDITFTVTALSGDPDLYVGMAFDPQHQIPGPGIGHYNWSATAYREDSITIGHSQPHCVHCFYYIGIYGFSASSYSITATFANDSRSVLQNGIPSYGSVAREAFRFYSFQLRSDAHLTDISIALTPLTGSPIAYVSINQEPTLYSYYWRTYTSFGSITIRSSDIRFCSNCTYYIGVYGVTASTYSIVAASSHSIISLLPGIPVYDSISQNEWQIFSFWNTIPGIDLVFSLTSLSGDPDLYISKDMKPNSTYYSCRAMSFGSDACNVENATIGRYYAGVFGFSNSSYILTIYLSNETDSRRLTALLDGVPISSIVPQWHFKYYIIQLTQLHSDLTISLNRQSGDPDLYVLYARDIPTTSNPPLPSATNFTWRSTSAGHDIIAIDNPAIGYYVIGVFGFSSSQYTLLAATSDATTVLLEARPVSAYVSAGKYDNFVFNLDRTNAVLTITVTAFNGNPELYISDTFVRPDRTHYNWSAATGSSDTIILPGSLLRIGQYYISVYGTTNLTFTILASLNRTIVLQDGIPQRGFLLYGQSNYYNFSVTDPHSSLTITVVQQSGRAGLYVSTSTVPYPGSPSSYQWSSMLEQGNQIVRISNTDRFFCSRCNYQILVTSLSTRFGTPNCSFILTASTNHTPVVLTANVPQYASVEQGKYEYFMFTVNDYNADIAISITSLAGDPDVYVGITDSPLPTNDSYLWHSEAWGSDVVHIDFSDPNFVFRRPYYIGVRGYTTASFTITASVTILTNDSISNDIIQLFDGYPQTGLVTLRSTTRYYRFWVDGSDQSTKSDVSFTVIPFYGDPDIYIRNDTVLPNEENAFWSGESYGSDSVTVHDGCIRCLYTIAVTSWERTLFSVVASAYNHITLQDGVPFTGFVWTNDTVYFRIDTVRGATSLTVYLAALGTGNPDLYITDNEEHDQPGPNSYTYSSVTDSNELIVIPQVNASTYYIGVFGRSPASFILTATMQGTGSAVLLVDGQQQITTLRANNSRLFVFHVNDVNRMVNVTFSFGVTTTGTVDMYILRDDTPTESRSEWSTSNPAGGRTEIQILYNDPKACFNCSYEILVVARSDVSFSLTASTISQAINLLVGQPTVSSVSRGGFRTFRAFIDSSEYDVNFDITTYSGFADLYVSTNSYPNKTSYLWCAVGGVSHLTISTSDSRFRPGIFFITVYEATNGASDCAFSIAVTTVYRMLMNGIPLTGSFRGLAVGNFFFFTNSNTEPVDLSFIVTADIKQPQEFNIYISTVTPTPGDLNSSIWQFKAITSKEPANGAYYVATISKTDKNYCTSCTYYVGLYGTQGSKFTIVSSDEQAYITLTDNTHLPGLVKQEQYKYYQIYVVSSRNFSLVLEPCKGNADLYASVTTFKPSEHEHDWAATTQDKVDTIEMSGYLIHSSLVFISVKGEKSASIPAIEYRIHARTTRDAATPPKIPEPTITADLSTPNQVNLKFQAAIPGVGASKLIYYVYYSEKMDGLVMYSACGLARATLSCHFEDTGETSYSCPIKNLKRQEYHFNVLVQDKDNGLQNFYNAIISEPNIPSDDSSDSGLPLTWLLGIGVPVFVVTMAAIIYLVIRNRKLSKELQIEMHDVPKAIVRKAVGGSLEDDAKTEPAKPSKQDKNYSRLLTEDDEDAPQPFSNEL